MPLIWRDLTGEADGAGEPAPACDKSTQRRHNVTPGLYHTLLSSIYSRASRPTDRVRLAERKGLGAGLPMLFLEPS